MTTTVYQVATKLEATGPLEKQLLGYATIFDRLEAKQAAFVKGLAGLRLPGSVFSALGRYEKELGGLTRTSGRVSSAIHADLAKAFGGSVADANRLKGVIRSWGTETGAVEGKLSTFTTVGLGGALAKADAVKAAIGSWGTELAAVENRMKALNVGGAGSSGSGGRHRPSFLSRAADAIALGPTDTTLLAGMGVGKLPLSMLKANANVVSQQNIHRLGGAQEFDVAAGLDAAYKSATLVPNVGVAEQYKLLREMSSATGDEAGSRLMLADVARSKTIMEAVTGRHGDEDVKKLFKFIELRGVAIDEHLHKIDTEKFGGELKYATKAMVAAQGLITPNDMLQFAKQAGPMAKGMDGEQLFASYLASLEDMGGARTGTSLTAVGRQFIGGIMTGKSASLLDKRRNKKFQNKKHGEIVKEIAQDHGLEAEVQESDAFAGKIYEQDTAHHRSNKLYKSLAQVDGKGDPLVYEDHHSGKTQAQIDKLTKSRAKNTARHELEVVIQMPADLSTDVRMKLNLSGTGTIYDQEYDIDQVVVDVSWEEGGLMVIQGKSAREGRKVT